jgi:hypothetical protein
MIITAVFAKGIAPYHPYDIDQRLQFTASSLEH